MIGRRIATLAAAVLLSANGLRAGMGPTDVLVVYDPADPNGVAVAQYYQQLRGAPDALMAPYSFPKSKTNTPSALMKLSTQQTLDLINFVRNTINSRNLSNQVDGVVLAGATPYGFSISSLVAALFTGPNITSTNDLHSRFPTANTALGFYSQVFRSTALPTTEMRCDKAFNSDHYWAASSLGFTGPRGNSAHEVFAMLRASRFADGWKPDGTVYWPTNDNVRSTTRAYEIGAVSNEWANLGVDYLMFPGTIPSNKTNAPGSFPATNRAPIGGFIGYATFSLRPSKTTYLPGSIAEHLTSYGTYFENTSQTHVSGYVRVGVCGTGGTVNEPYAYWQKFPHARMYSHYAAGASLGEAFWESLSNPFQYFIIADPLTQPYADIPVVSFTNLDEGATISGTITVLVSATTASTNGLESNLDLAVDGRVLRIGDAGETVGATRVTGGFALDTTTLPDGWHDLRAIAYNNNAIRTQGHGTRGAIVNNLGRSVALTGPASLERRTNDLFTGAVSGGGTITNLAIRTGGRVLATLPTSGGSASLDGSLLAFETTNRLQAVADYADGTQIRSAPLTVYGDWSLSPATNGVSLNSNSVAYVNFFYDARSGGFSWTNAPTARAFFSNSSALSIAATTNFPFVAANTNNFSGHEFISYFNAPSNDVYDLILFDPQGEFTLLVDNQPLYNAVTGSTSAANAIVVPEKLAAGRHEVRLRTRLTGASNKFDFYVRGGGLYNGTTDQNDAFLAKTNSSAPNLAVDTFDPPTISILTPTEGQVFTSTRNVTLTASASGNIGVYLVEYFNGTNRIGSSGTGSYSVTWSNVPAGSYTVHARVTDKLAFTNISTAINFDMVLLATPTFAPESGLYSQPQAVRVDCTDFAAIIHYTLNGGTPTESDPVIVSGGTILLNSNTVLRAKAFKAGFNASEMHTAVYRFGAGAVAAGYYHSMALLSDGSIRAWGYNTYGQLGDGSTTNCSTPVTVTGVTNAVVFDAGWYHSMTLCSDAIIGAWGYNTFGQLGNGSNVNSSTLTNALFNGSVDVASGGYHSLAVADDGFVWACGYNYYGQLGNGTTTNRWTPVRVTNSTSFVAVAAGAYHSVTLSSNTTVWCWGYNSNGQLGNGSTTNAYRPVRVTGLSNIVAVAAGDYHTLAASRDGSVWTWGLNSDGQLGTGTMDNQSNAVQVSLLNNVIALAGGAYHSLALCSNGTVWAWGYNNRGQLGNGSTNNSSVPVQVSGLTNIVSIAGGGHHSLALGSDGTVWAWGYNNYGQLGNGSATNCWTPVAVTGLVTITAPAAPSALSATAASSSQIDLTWTDQSNNESSFKIERKTGANGAFAQIAATSANIASFSDTNCAAGTMCYYRVRASNAIGDSAYCTEANATTPITWDTWRSSHFTAGELADPNVSGPTADPDGDGLSNLMEYALNRNPKSPDAGGVFVTGAVQDSGQQYLSLTCHRRLAATDLTFTPESGGDLSYWSGTDCVIVSVTDDGNGLTETVVVRDTYPMATNPKRFMHLRVTQ